MSVYRNNLLSIDMGTNPEPVPVQTPPEEPSAFPLSGILFGAAFMLLAAGVFTTTLRSHFQAEAPVEILPMPSLPLKYPATRTGPAFDTLFGVKVPDPYRWLEDGKSPEVQDWLKAENSLAPTYLDALPGRAALQKRFHELLYIDTITAPGRAGDRYFYMKRSSTQEKAVL